MSESNVIELSEEDIARRATIAARKIFLAEEAERNARSRALYTRRRIVDVEATAKMLLDKKKVTQAWINRQRRGDFSRMVRTACVAYMVKAISMTGEELDLNPPVGRIHAR